MIVSIVGADGTGKSSITKMLSESLIHKNIPFELLNKWDVFDLEKHPECRMLANSHALVRQCISEMRGPSRMLFIYWTLYTALSKVKFKPDTLYLLDGYWEKHAAVEAIFGVDEEWILNIVRLLPIADVTIFLNTPASIRYERKELVNDFVPYEFGFAKELNKETFLSHQLKLEKVMHSWSVKYNWHKIDANRNINEVFSAAEEYLLRQLQEIVSHKRSQNFD